MISSSSEATVTEQPVNNRQAANISHHNWSISLKLPNTFCLCRKIQQITTNFWASVTKQPACSLQVNNMSHHNYYISHNFLPRGYLLDNRLSLGLASRQPTSWQYFTPQSVYSTKASPHFLIMQEDTTDYTKHLGFCYLKQPAYNLQVDNIPHHDWPISLKIHTISYHYYVLYNSVGLL